MAKILLIDDNAQLLALLTQVLEAAGHPVFSATDGERAMRVARSESLDLIITDILMPMKDGLETIQEVKKVHPELPVIAISGGGRMPGRNYLLLAKGLGADAVMEKPFSMADFLNMVKQVLAGNRSGQLPQRA